MKNLLIFTLFSFVICQLNAQNTKTITVTGQSSMQLSPNEIIIAIKYSEYWTLPDEKQKTPIEDIEKVVLQSLKSAGVKAENMTFSAVRLEREYDRNKRRFHKRTLSKSVNICVYTADDIARVIKALEKDNLLERAVTEFRIAEVRHTEMENYKQQVKKSAVKDAKAKAELIVGTLGQRLGDIVTIKEVSARKDTQGMSAYSTANPGTNSGVSAMTISYELEAVFEIE